MKRKIILLLLVAFMGNLFAEETYSFGDFVYKINKNNTITITDYSGSDTNLFIPSEINGLSVTSIGEWAFAECYSLTSISIPDSVTSIGGGVFYDCENLTDVKISADNNNFEIINKMLCNKKEKSVISCYSKESNITIPSGILKIEDSAFYYCNSLKSITIPNSVTSIGEGAFSNCTSLESITIPDSVISIGDKAFYHCYHLTSSTISKLLLSADILTSVKLSQSLNTPPPIEITESGIVMLSREIHLENASLPIEVTESEIVILSIDPQEENAFLPIEVTELGIIMLVRESQV